MSQFLTTYQFSFRRDASRLCLFSFRRDASRLCLFSFRRDASRGALARDAKHRVSTMETIPYPKYF
ncbi:MAG: hypothetical protein VSS75_010090 [Candidatus Parabeggiatoa sp.]|nr:hypothetical protein [Candidatus Parabeggiatoa sp.]